MSFAESLATLLVPVWLLAVPALYAQGGQAPKAAPPPKPQPDILMLVDGEKLIGHLERAAGGSVVFKSDVVGEVTIGYDKIKELQTEAQFAVVPKGLKLSRHEDTSVIPQGSLSIADKKIEVRPSGGQAPSTIPVEQSAYVIDEATFRNAVLRRTGIFEQWKGAFTAGASLVEATQHSQSFTGSANLVRSLPPENWMDRSNRTLIDFSVSSGKLTQPGTANVKTEIFHGDAERDEYFTQNVYAFGQAAFDHNFSQGLDLEQSYGVGVGWTVRKRANEELDLKVSMNYIGQSFMSPVLAPNSSENQQLIGSTFAQNYMHRFKRGLVLNEGISVTPTWNNLNAYLGAANVTLAMPFYKHFSVSVTTADTFINNPPPTFKKMSFQFTTGITYTLP